MRNQFIIASIVVLAIVGAIAPFWMPVLWSLILILPLILLGIMDLTQTKHTIKRNYPLLGRGRWLMEWMRPKVMQYFCGE